MVPPGAGEALHVLGDVVTSLVTGADTGGAYAVQQQATHPGSGPPLYRHSREDEGFFVLEGEYEFWVGEQTFRAGHLFARENWTAFLSVADEGWGQLLIRISSQRVKRHGGRLRKRYRSLAG